MARYYDWQATFSRQTGTNGEHCLVLGAKNIGKTFGLRLACINRFLKAKEKFVEICRTKDERDLVAPGYFDKIQAEGFFSDYLFKVEKNCGYIAKRPANDDDKPEYELLCYFVALTAFQTEKKRTFVKPKRFIFDEAVIDTKDRYHNYLPDEFLILANILDTISRQQPGDKYQFQVFYLGNAVDMTCPYLRHLGIDKVPSKFGYHYYRNKTVLLHYVEPWDAEDRKARTLVGRMLEGNEESAVVFDNIFEDKTGGEIMRKTPNAKFKYAIKWKRQFFALWIDDKRALWFISPKVPKDANNIFTLTKSDSSVNYKMVSKTDGFVSMISNAHRYGCVRYESASIREAFFEVLSFIGVK